MRTTMDEVCTGERVTCEGRTDMEAREMDETDVRANETPASPFV